MTLTEILETWVKGAERMHGGAASGVVVTRELFTHLRGEQSQESPSVSGLDVFVAASETPTGEGLLPLSEMVEIAGPDRVCIYVGARPSESTFPLGHDPAMPVVFVPLPPNAVEDPAALEMYNRLRWIGLGPEEALAGAGR
ncbi:MAG TPA: hypothetical protein VGR26_16490 [Acidimicrobiales bacterium]|nr:hypothetical protein [Acidimicrobiales bacterium]